MPTRIEWHGDAARAEIRADIDRALTAIAIQIEAQAKVNITDNGQVDTGFLRSSGYVIGPGVNSFTDIPAGGTFTSEKSGDQVQRDRVPSPEQPPEGGAVVGFAADYAVWQEEANSFLFRAAEMVAGSVAEAEVRRVAR
jgi:hypothetical protein